MFKFTSALVAFASAQIRVTCVGDSITEWGDWVLMTGSYCDKMVDMLGPGYQVLNAGKASKTMLKDGLENDGTPMSYWDTD